MSEGEDEEAVVILSVAVTPEVAKALDNFIGLKGDTREEVASHYVCAPHGGKRQKCGDRPDGTTPPDAAPPGGPQANESGEGEDGHNDD